MATTSCDLGEEHGAYNDVRQFHHIKATIVARDLHAKCGKIASPPPPTLIPPARQRSRYSVKMRAATRVGVIKEHPMATGSTTDIVAQVTVPVLTPTARVPRLESGDRLTRPEFERRYEAMPEVKKAELIEGVVFLPSPVRMDIHGGPQADLLTWLGTFRSATPGVRVGDNATLNLDNDNEPQPDALLMIDALAGGQAKLDSKGYIKGAPELVAEIASSSVSIDLHAKLNVYRRSGVREYIAWRVLDRAIDWFVLRDGQFVPLPAGGDGVIRSEVFPGLWLNMPAMLDGKLDVALATLREGMATPEHQAFAASLAKS
jgi:Uma2 family endonuclease